VDPRVSEWLFEQLEVHDPRRAGPRGAVVLVEAVQGLESFAEGRSGVVFGMYIPQCADRTGAPALAERGREILRSWRPDADAMAVLLDQFAPPLLRSAGLDVPDSVPRGLIAGAHRGARLDEED